LLVLPLQCMFRVNYIAERPLGNQSWIEPEQMSPIHLGPHKLF
jgi:hypothetical protein